MSHNLDVQEIHNGQLTDMRIEAMINCILRERWKEESFDILFNEIVNEFVDKRVPPFKAAQAAMDPYGYAAIGLLDMMQFDFIVVSRDSGNWPGAFDYQLDARYAVSLYYRNDHDKTTQYAPGRTITAAVLCAVMQYARERSAAIFNQGELRLQ